MEYSPIIKQVIIVAGGSGSRMNSAIPKQFLLLSGRPLVMHTLERIYTLAVPDHIILVLPPDHFSYWQSLCKQYRFAVKHQLAPGGRSRFESVKNGLMLIQPGGLVAVHDGVRPLVSRSTVEEVFRVALEKGNAVPIVRVNESIRMITGDSSQSLDRNACCLVQTPQCFETEILLEAYQQEYQESFTDDASVVENLGIPIHVVEGNRENIKITSGSDLEIAEILLRNME